MTTTTTAPPTSQLQIPSAPVSGARSQRQAGQPRGPQVTSDRRRAPGDNQQHVKMIKCDLDENGCISLLAVLKIMSQVNQEQTWAIAYEVAALMQRLWPAGNCATIESLAQIYIHRDGFVHEKSLLVRGPRQTPASPDRDEPAATSPTNLTNPNGSQQAAASATMPPTPPISPELNELLQGRRAATSEHELVASLGIALFWALDYGIPDDEERKLSRTMEYLIVQSQASELSLGELINICVKRLPSETKQTAGLHYRSVCRALVSDTVELSIFLDRIYTASVMLGDYADLQDNDCGATIKGAGSPTIRSLVAVNNNAASECDFLHHHHHQLGLDEDELSELGLPLASLRALKINDWARLWMQVIRELRQRGRFQKQ